ncbi:MAG: CotH kinase family protein [Myxococcaceae bacterium]|nr:CotH kinase family protein [Myxococcaceae bacterium]
MRIRGVGTAGLAALLAIILAGCGAGTPPSGNTDPPAEPAPGPGGHLADGHPRLGNGAWTLPPLQTSLETYALEVPEATLKLFEDDVYAPEQPATFIFDGVRYPVTIRLRGQSARTFPKKSWNVDFNDLRFQGREELNLVAEYQDQTMLVEKLAYDLAAAMGIPAPRTKYVRLVINGRYMGVFLDIEEVDKKFLKAHGMPDRDADIWRCGLWDCEMKLGPRHPAQGEWTKVTNKESLDTTRLQQLLVAINRTAEPDFADRLGEVMDVDEFLRVMALEAIISNNFVEDSRSYWVDDRVTGRWYYVPWDLNNADPRWWPTYGYDMEPIVDHDLYPFTLQNPWLQDMYDRRKEEAEGYEPTFDNLRTRIVANPALRARLVALTERARTELLDPALLHPWLDAMHALVAPHLKDDPFMDPKAFELGLPYLKQYVTGRNAFVAQELTRLSHEQPGLVIEAFDPVAGWIELGNRGNQSVSTAGMVLTTNLRHAAPPFMTPNVPAMTLQPGERRRLDASALGLDFAASSEVGLSDGLSVAHPYDFLFYPLPSFGHYARDAHTGAWTLTP